eukprot:Skav231089  [mRNA]  locus=scaffold524:508241:515942:+ [translate_table: standard]
MSTVPWVGPTAGASGTSSCMKSRLTNLQTGVGLGVGVGTSKFTVFLMSSLRPITNLQMRSPLGGDSVSRLLEDKAAVVRRSSVVIRGKSASAGAYEASLTSFSSNTGRFTSLSSGKTSLVP